jgi:hypothetical protein
MHRNPEQFSSMGGGKKIQGEAAQKLSEFGAG